MRCRLFGVVLGVIAITAAFSGCQSAQPARSAVQILEPVSLPVSADSKEVRLENVEPVDYSPAKPFGLLAAPEYPPEALAAKVGEYIAYVRITIDEFGKVSEVFPSIRGLPMPHPQAEAFHAAILKAAKKWRFQPASLTHYKETGSGADKSYAFVRTELLTDTMDLRFTFEAPGKVR